jgi:Flp pilus assembly pilin Flp
VIRALGRGAQFFVARNDHGASAVEYSLLLALIAAVIYASVVLFGQHVVAAIATVVGRF